MTDIDQEVIEGYLDNAVMWFTRDNDFAVGLWLGRALEHAEQNAVDHEWMLRELSARVLDTGLVKVPKPRLVGGQG